MTKAIGRSALLAAAGLFVCFAGPAPAAAAGAEDAAAATKPETAGTPVALHNNVTHTARHTKKYAHRKSEKTAAKASPDKTADDADHAPAIPPTVANANAQLTAAQPTSADSPTDNAVRAMSVRANDILQAAPDRSADATPPANAQPDAQVVAADQLNDVDRALRESPPAASTPAAPEASAAAETPAAPVAASGQDSSAWDQTSLIGKIFIGFGALLTMASAARMFVG